MPAPTFVVMLRRGPAWRPSQALEGQEGWSEHAAFMDALVDEGFVLLGGPLEEPSGAMLIVRAATAAQIRSRLAVDPWVRRGLLHIGDVAAWTIRLGAL